MTLKKGMDVQGMYDIFLKEDISFLPIMLRKQAGYTCICRLVFVINTCLGRGFTSTFCIMVPEGNVEIIQRPYVNRGN